MVTNCGGPDFFGLTEEGFVLDIMLLMVVVIPASAVFIVWRLIVTNRARSCERLGLNDRVVDGRRVNGVAWPTLFLYFITIILPLVAGILLSEIKILAALLRIA